MIANSSYKKTESDDDEDEDEEDGDIQYNGTVDDRTIERDANKEGVEIEKRGASGSTSASASEDMSKILEEIRLIERGMFFDAIDPVAKR
jgi:hypothetical protein